MNQGLHPASRQMRLQLVAPFAKHGKQVIHVLRIGQSSGQPYQGIIQFAVVKISQRLSFGIILVQIVQFHVEHRRIEFRHAAVDALVFKHIFSFATVITQSPYNLSQFAVVCSYRPRIAESTQVLTGVKAVSSCIAQRTRFCSLPFAALTLRTVLHQQQSVFAANFVQHFVISHTSVKVHRHDALGARCQRRFDAFRVEFQVIERRFHRHRHQSVICDSQESCDVSIGRHHDFVALGQSPQFFVSANNQTQRVESVSRADTFRRTYILCIMFFKA